MVKTAIPAKNQSGNRELVFLVLDQVQFLVFHKFVYGGQTFFQDRLHFFNLQVNFRAEFFEYLEGLGSRCSICRCNGFTQSGQFVVKPVGKIKQVLIGYGFGLR
jgi:hypothetical protein